MSCFIPPPFNLFCFLQAIFFGGIDVSIRGEVWPFLLHYYSHESTSEEREALRAQKRKEYAAIQQKRCTWAPEVPSELGSSPLVFYEPWFLRTVSLPRANTIGRIGAVTTRHPHYLGPGPLVRMPRVLEFVFNRLN